MKFPPIEEQLNLIRLGTEEIIPEELLIKKLEYSRANNIPLNIKLGCDPSRPDLHIGHAVVLRKLRHFQDLGHNAILVIGDFTAMIGDPSGRNKTRPQLTIEEAKNYAQTYVEQSEKILDIKNLKVKYNSKWLSKMNFNDVVKLSSSYTVARMLERDDFTKRFQSEIPISIHEFLYPLAQGQDSVELNADVELGGTDQKFNIAMGRDLQKAFGQKPQFGMLLPILVGLDGTQKMSKSLNNFVGINEDSLSMYSKLEKVPDDLVFSYLNLLTDENLNELSSSPREVQKFMALKITSNFKGVEAAKKAQSNSEKLILGNQNSLEEIPESSISNVNFPAKAFYLFSKMKLCSSSSEARRQILGGGVRIDGEKIEDPNLEFDTPDELIGKILQVGKKKFLRVSN